MISKYAKCITLLTTKEHKKLIFVYLMRVWRGSGKKVECVTTLISTFWRWKKWLSKLASKIGTEELTTYTLKPAVIKISILTKRPSTSYTERKVWYWKKKEEQFHLSILRCTIELRVCVVIVSLVYFFRQDKAWKMKPLRWNLMPKKERNLQVTFSSLLKQPNKQTKLHQL